jgi:hypothetical protein
MVAERLKTAIGSEGSVKRYETVAKGILVILKDGVAPFAIAAICHLFDQAKRWGYCSGKTG